MDFEFETTRTGLANAFAAAGAELLNYMGSSATQAAIPDTQPEKYAIAGTLPGILQMAGKMMGEEAAEKPTDERIFALWGMAIEQFQRHEAGVSVHPSIYLSRAIEAELLAARAAAEKPTGDLTDAQIIETMAKYSRFLEPGLYSQTDFDCPEDMISFARDIERAANAAHFERQAQAEPLTVKVERNRVWIVRGNQSFMLDYAADEGDDPAEIEWYANQLRAVLSGFTPDVKIAVPSAAALRDEVRTQHDEILALHRRLAAETMRADDGWRRADAKSRECIELRERMAAPASQEGAHAARNEVLEEAALAAKRVQDEYRESQSGKWPELRDDAETGAGDCVTAIRALQTPASAERSGEA